MSLSEVKGCLAPPIVIIHPGALPTSSWTEFQSRWEGELMVIELENNREYLLEALGSDDKTLTVESLIADVERELRAQIDLTGRWILVGWSFGGVIANAVLPRLTNEELPMGMCLLDSIAASPEYIVDFGEARELSVKDRARALSWFCMYLSAKQGIDLDLSEMDFFSKELNDALSLVLERSRERSAPIGLASVDGLKKVFEVFVSGLRRNNRLAGDCSATSCPVGTILVRPDRSLLPNDPYMGWYEVSEDLDVVRVPGDHYSMISDPDAVRQITSRLVSIP